MKIFILRIRIYNIIKNTVTEDVQGSNLFDANYIRYVSNSEINRSL